MADNVCSTVDIEYINADHISKSCVGSVLSGNMRPFSPVVHKVKRLESIIPGSGMT